MSKKAASPRKSSDALTITVEAAGKKLGISRGAAYEAARSGQIPTLRIGRRVLVPSAAFDRLLQGTVKAG